MQLWARVFKKNVASENCSHLLKRKPRRTKCRFPVESGKAPKSHYTEKKEKKIERKQKEMKVKNVVPLLFSFLFLFSVVVFAFFVFFFFFIAYTLETVFTTIGQ